MFLSIISLGTGLIAGPPTSTASPLFVTFPTPLPPIILIPLLFEK